MVVATAFGLATVFCAGLSWWMLRELDVFDEELKSTIKESNDSRRMRTILARRTPRQQWAAMSTSSGTGGLH